MSCVVLYIRAPENSGYTTPNAMKRVDDDLTANYSTVMFCPPPLGLPVQEADGTWQVRVLNSMMAGIVKGVLSEHYGFTIEREETIG